MTTSKTIYQVDAFSAVPFKGNPAGVCIMDSEISTHRMQNLAMEMNLAEIAFVHPLEDGFKLRFFSPKTEITLCGHATLSASHILYETGIVDSHDEIKFTCKASELKARKKGNWIIMDFPSYKISKIDNKEEFKTITGIDPLELYKTNAGWYLALMRNESDVKSLKPHFESMRNSKFGDIMVTAETDDQKFDFCVRCFAPGVGIDEDPVTGSAHCALVPFWKMKTGRNDFISHQVSRRGGILKVSMKNDRVEISGHAITVFRTEVLI
jgi:PhzF family phenazine biosynthesis protein